MFGYQITEQAFLFQCLFRTRTDGGNPAGTKAPDIFFLLFHFFEENPDSIDTCEHDPVIKIDLFKSHGKFPLVSCRLYADRRHFQDFGPLFPEHGSRL